MAKEECNLPTMKVLVSIRAQIIEAFDKQRQNIRSDESALDLRGGAQEASLRARALENRRMLQEVHNVFGQIECDIQNQRQP